VSGDISLHDPGHAEVAHLGAVAEEQQILRLQVAVLDPQALTAVDRVPGAVEIIDRVGDGVQVAEELSARDAAQALAIRLEEAVPERAVGELHADDQEVLDLPGAVDDQQAGVPDAPRDLQGAQLAGPEVG